MQFIRHRLLRQVMEENELTAWQLSRIVTAMLPTLSDRERMIVDSRMSLFPRTLESIGKELGISRERVRQIEFLACAKIAKAARWLYSYEK